VIVNAEKGDLEIIRRRMIVEDGQVEDPLSQIAYSDAIKLSLTLKWVKKLTRKLTV
jgi:N utilization substance protein A